jgi:taurine dioxygenase
MIRFRRLTGSIGADVHGIDLSLPLGEKDVSAIRDGLLEHLVLFFREQPLLSVEQHKALASHFGELEPTTYTREGVDPMVYLMSITKEPAQPVDAAPLFHTDSAFKEERSLGSILQARILPEFGGDTTFVSMYAAYDALSEPMRGFLDGLLGVNSLYQMAKTVDGMNNLRFSFDEHPPIKTPVVGRHPETGRKFLNVNMMYTSHIDGLTAGESDALLRYLFAHIQRHEFAVRLHWNPGDIAFWDNWSTQHCPVGDYVGLREMQRISILRRPEESATKALSCP